MTQESTQQDNTHAADLEQSDLQDIVSRDLAGWTVAAEPPASDAVISPPDAVSPSLDAFQQRHQAMQDAEENASASESAAALSVPAKSAVPSEAVKSMAAQQDHIVLVNAPDASSARGGGAGAKAVIVSGSKSQVIGMQG